MNRRAAGGIVLLFAVVCALVLPSLTTPGVTGAASIDRGVPPLPVGTCVRDDVTAGVTDGGPMGSAPAPVGVDCALPHWGEVAVLDLLSDGAEQPRTCRNARIASYLAGAPEPAASTAAVRVDVTAIGPDAQQYAGGQRWIACLVHAETAIVGSVAAVTVGEPAPALGRCYEGPFATFDALLAPCTSPHGGELFRYLAIDLARQPTRAEVDAWCAAAIDAATGRRDLPGLTVVTDVFAWFADRQSRFVDLPVPSGARGATALCGVRVDGDRLLSSSLRQLGAADLPWVG